MRRRLIALVAVVAVAAAPAAAAMAQQGSLSLADLEDEVMCPTCGTALGLSESPQASQIRDQIRGLIGAGLSKEEIKDELVAEYGPEVLALPETSGFDLAAWIVPALALLVAAAAIVTGARRWRARGAALGPAGAGAGLDPADEERLRADLERYQL